MACFMAIVVCVALTADTACVPSAPPPHTVHHPGSGQRKQGRQLHQQVPAVQEHAAAALTTGPGRTSVCLSVCLSVRTEYAAVLPAIISYRMSMKCLYCSYVESWTQLYI